MKGCGDMKGYAKGGVVSKRRANDKAVMPTDRDGDGYRKGGVVRKPKGKKK